MPTIEASGTQTTTGGEDTLFTSTLPRAFLLTIDLAAMQAGDTVSVRGYVKATIGGTLRQFFAQTFSGVQAVPNIGQVTIAVPSPYQCSFRIQRTAGTDRAYPWNVSSICNVTAELTGTQATTASEVTLGSDIITNRVCIVLTDHNAQPASGSVTLKAKVPALSGGAVQTIFQTSTTVGVLVDPEIIQVSAPLSAPHQFRATIQRIAGADHNVQYTICSLAAA